VYLFLTGEIENILYNGEIEGGEIPAFDYFVEMKLEILELKLKFSLNLLI
jgi:hypothetical protein